MTVELDGRQMYNRKTAHDHLQTQLELPDYYGRNLDALYDLLTENTQPKTVIVRFPEEAEKQLGHYGTALLATLKQAANNNPALVIQLEEKQS